MGEPEKNYARDYLSELQGILDSIGEDIIAGLDKIAALMNEARRNKKTVFTMGNGGLMLQAAIGGQQSRLNPYPPLHPANFEYNNRTF